MSNLMARGMSMLNRQLAVAAGITISYTRAAGGAPVTLTTFVHGNANQLNESGPGDAQVRHGYEEDDFIGPAEDLVQSDTVFEPAVGDRITETIRGTTYRFEVMATPQSKAWDWSDSGRTRIRIHTKRIKAA